MYSSFISDLEKDIVSLFMEDPSLSMIEDFILVNTLRTDLPPSDKFVFETI